MNTKTTSIDIRPERDPRYTAAKARYTELKRELDALERQRDDVQTGIGSLASRARDQIAEEATLMLSGTPAPDPANLKREALIKTLDDLTHRLAVLRAAVAMQRDIVGKLLGEVSNAIARDMLPRHRANVGAVVEALLQLNAALEAEADLRETLNENNVSYMSVMRPMPISGFGTLRDNQGRIFRYLLECHEYGFVAAPDLPDVVRDQIPPPVKSALNLVARSNDGWAA